jgi:hypothetical protein
MYLNDKLGDCTCAAAGHLIQLWSADLDVPTDNDILVAYEAVSGYNPQTGANDNGAVELDVMNYWRQAGIAGNKIEAFAKINVSDETEIKQSVYIFGTAYIGVQLPITCQNQEVWDVVLDGGADAQPGSWGGHAVPVVEYNATGPVVVTWGALKQMTWNFWHTYVDEAYAIIDDIFAARGITPEGFDLTALRKDLESITGVPTPTPAPSSPRKSWWSKFVEWIKDFFL